MKALLSYITNLYRETLFLACKRIRYGLLSIQKYIRTFKISTNYHKEGSVYKLKKCLNEINFVYIVGKMFKFTQQKIFRVKNELVYVIDRCYIILIVKVEKSNLILTLLFL